MTSEKAKIVIPIYVGGGLGTCAESILNYLQENYPNLYKNTHYTILEISESLAKKQTQKLKAHINNSNGKVQVRTGSIFDWKTKVEEDCFVIALEVLDNFPHDKVVRFGGDGGYYETVIIQNGMAIFSLVDTSVFF